MDCQCPVAGYCERYKRKMMGRMHHICHGDAIMPNGTLMPEAKREAYQRLWLADANGEARPVPTHSEPPTPAKNYGPGKELELLWASLKLTIKPSCPCKGMLLKMNEWGPQGCRDHKDEIVEHLRIHKGNFGLTEKTVATLMAVKTGLAFKINWMDPFPDCVDIAIERAEAKERSPKHPIPKHP